jgi:membrane associated rhomboid family serine protease
MADGGARERGAFALLDDLAAHPVSGGTVLAAVVLNVAGALGTSLEHLILAGDQDFLGEPWRMFTTVLPHGGWLHLAFNVAWTWILGRRVEAIFGSLPTLGIFALLAAVPIGAEYALLQGGIGLSGVCYGLFGMLWILERRDPRFAGALDGNLARLFVVWFFLCIGLTWAGVLAVANLAHGVGALVGGLLGLSVVADRLSLPRAATVFLTLLVLFGGSVARERVNLSGAAARGFFARAIEALRDGDFERAVEAGQSAVSEDPEFPEAWHNLGVAFSRLERYERALEAFERARALDPDDPLYESAVASLRTMLRERDR